jgi:hypothetical protein
MLSIFYLFIGPSTPSGKKEGAPKTTAKRTIDWKID